MTEQWRELKETITEMRDNDGTGTQQEVCKFLANYMETLEKQMQEPSEDAVSCNCTTEEIAKSFIEDVEAVKDQLEQQPCEDTEVIKVSKGAVKARQGRFVIYDVDWLKENFYTTEEKIYGQPKQPCADAVSRQAVIDHICEDKECYKEECKGRTLKRCPDLQWVFDLPPVTPQRPKGKWIVISCEPTDIFKCSECGMRVVNPYKYCPNCGSYNGGGEDEISN